MNHRYRTVAAFLLLASCRGTGFPGPVQERTGPLLVSGRSESLGEAVLYFDRPVDKTSAEDPSHYGVIDRSSGRIPVTGVSWGGAAAESEVHLFLTGASNPGTLDITVTGVWDADLAWEAGGESLSLGMEDFTFPTLEMEVLGPRLVRLTASEPLENWRDLVVKLHGQPLEIQHLRAEQPGNPRAVLAVLQKSLPAGELALEVPPGLLLDKAGYSLGRTSVTAVVPPEQTQAVRVISCRVLDQRRVEFTFSRGVLAERNHFSYLSPSGGVEAAYDLYKAGEGVYLAYFSGLIFGSSGRFQISGVVDYSLNPLYPDPTVIQQE